MVHYCCCFGCNEKFVKGGGITFHSFPKEEERRKVWIKNINRLDFIPSAYAKVCSKHFAKECFDTEKFGGVWLKEDAVPTIFNFSVLRIPRKPAKRRVDEESSKLQAKEQEVAAPKLLPLDNMEISSEVVSRTPGAECHSQLQMSYVSDTMTDETNTYGRDQQDSNGADITTENQSKKMDESDVILSEDVVFTLQMLNDEVQNVILPSRLWVVHKHPFGRFVAFSRVPLQFEENQIIADKVVVFAQTMIPAVFFKEIKLNLPSMVSKTPLQSLEQVSDFLHKIQRLAFCKSEVQVSKCRIYLDMPSSIGYCSKCREKHIEKAVYVNEDIELDEQI